MEIQVADHPERTAAAWIARRAGDARRRRGRVSLALSGGSTAPALISALSQLPVAWDSVTVWQVDERIAPDGDPGRNAGQLSDMPCRVLLMPVTSPDLDRAAVEYARSLPDRFDVVHLGLGDDGHTASWPPGNTGVLASSRDVDVTPEFNAWRRMTLTPRVVNGARSRLVLATGAGKRSVVERWLLRDPALPIDAVRRAGTVVFLDPAAAPEAALHDE
jgi:6-phosphogluconolactonase/glucosamine-6-phosphate isomerase/deaminase